jgi:nitroimidazol reductase NimA-like FMN-containing flavoprotein (pyridoxamine 5'-phosphate oxidase superfamily)
MSLTVLNNRELKFLRSRVLGRLATASRDLQPHVVPVVYAADGEDVIVAVDYGTKKLKNLRENQKVALIVDDYRPNRGLMIQGESEILEKGKEYLRLQKLLYDKFEFYRDEPWKEGEAPILKIRPRKSASWGV